MAFTVDPLTYIISVPQADLTHVGGTLYTFNTDTFRLGLKAWEASEEGMPHPKTHDHNTEVTIAGVTYARSINILAPYSIEFEDGQYSVILEGSNNNIFDIAEGILEQNQVQVIPTNSAGLITVIQGSGVTEQDKLDIADRVWDEQMNEHEDAGSAGEAVAGSGVTEQDKLDIADRVWDEPESEHDTPGTFGARVKKAIMNFLR